MSLDGVASDAQPVLRGPLPGARGAALVEVLARTECPALTARRARRAEKTGAPHDPITWTHARGVHVRDADGNVFVDLTAGFGVAAIGHTHPRVVASVREQAGRLLHALGDVYPSDVKVALLARLQSIAPFEGARVMLGLSGADAIEAALKTAMLATRRPGVLAFVGGYHGLSHGPLAACGYSDAFRAPFAAQLNPHVRFAPYPARDEDLREALAPVEALLDDTIGAVLVEPIQSRGGVHVPPDGFLAALAALTHARGALVIADEIYTGLGRTGPRWRSAQDGADVDLLCTGKALGGGLPISACLGREEVMRAWGDPAGEALHTSTFLGSPLACAAALAALDVLEDEALGARAVAVGATLAEALRSVGTRHGHAVVGDGMLLGLRTGARTLGVVRALLERGWITLPAGRRADVLQITPPLTLPVSLIEAFAGDLDACLAEAP